MMIIYSIEYNVKRIYINTMMLAPAFMVNSCLMGICNAF